MSTQRPARRTALALLSLGAALLVGQAAHAQQRPGSGLPSPRLLAVSPAGGKVGTTFDVACAGLNLENPERLLFSNPAIKAELFAEPPPPKPDPKVKPPRRPPVMTGTPGVAKFKVTIPAGTPLGIHDVRVVNKWGVSNPRAFVVGDLTEVAEKEPNNEDTQAQRVELNATVNGTIAAPTDVDYFVFAAKKGQRVVISCLASSIDSRLTPALEVYDAKGTQLATNRNYQRNDALTDIVAPADGDYQVRLIQFTHTFGQPIPGGMPGGFSDYFYRLSITTAPWIDAIHPVVLEPGKATTVTVHGRNLPGGKPDPTAVVEDGVLEKLTVSITPPATPEARQRLAYSGHLPPPTATVDAFEYRLRNDSGSSNPFLLALARAPVVLDAGDNDTAAKAQEIALPCEIAGRVEKRRDRDWYAFEAKKGESWLVEVFSARLGAPTYMAIVVRNPAAKNDLYESPINESMNLYSRKFFARSEDPPAYRFTAPADGKYQMLVFSRSADSQAGPRHSYQVRITREQPDFHLVAMSAAPSVPDAATVYAGGNQAFTVFAWRHGFAGDVELSVEGLPPGVTCPPQAVGAGVNQTTLVVSAAPGAAAWSGEIKVKGSALIRGNKVTREARSASIVWPVQPQQNITTFSRIDRSLTLAVRDKAAYNLRGVLDKAEVTQGDKATLTVQVERLWPEFKAPLTVQVMQPQQRQGSELPVNLRIQNNQPVNIAPGQKEGKFAVTVGPDVPPGVYNLVLRGQAQVPYNKDPMAKAKQPTFVILPSTPVTLTVVPKALATFTLGNTSATVKVGGQIELPLRVARRFDYEGEFKVQLVLPAGVTGVEADEVTIPAGKDEAKLVVRVPAGTAPGARNNLTVRAVALWGGKVPTNHEVKLNVNVAK